MKLHITQAKTYLSRKINCFRSDNGMEFANECLRNSLIIKVYSTSSQMLTHHNRVRRTIYEDSSKGSPMDSKMDPSFWPDTLNYVVYTCKYMS